MIYGTLNESDSISPSDDNEKRFTECEECKGTGHVYEYGEDGELQKEDCPECGGTGELEIED